MDLKCNVCGGSATPSAYCGAVVCDDENCNNHNGLVRCYCGWSADDNDGRKELEEMGETIEPEY